MNTESKPDAIAYVLAVLAVLAPLHVGAPYAHFVVGHAALVLTAFGCVLFGLRWAFRRILMLAQRGAHAVTPRRAHAPAVVVMCVVLGVLLAQVALAQSVYPSVANSSSFRALVRHDPTWSRYVFELLRWSLRAAVPLGLLWTVGFLQDNGVGLRRASARGKLPPYPVNPPITQLTLGEIHMLDGSRVEDPGYHVIPGLGLYTGTAIIGASGTGKTKGAIYPYVRQLIGLHRERPTERLGGLILDAKGDMLPDIREMCVQAGRLDDLLVIAPPDARVNVLARPELSGPALANYVRQAQEAVQGDSHSDTYWSDAAEELSMQVIRGARLAWQRPPTLADIVRFCRSDKAFSNIIAAAAARAEEFTDEEAQDLETLTQWYEEGFTVMDPKTRASVAANLSTFLSVFETPMMRRCFSPTPQEETFPGFARVIADGRIVVLSMPDALFKKESRVIGTLMKLGFQDAVRQRLIGAHGGAFRETFFVADEYSRFASSDDSDFYALCRAAKCINIVAVQAYSSFFTAGLDAKRVEHLMSQFGNKIYLRAHDDETAKAAASLCGKEERYIASRTVAENAQSTKFSFVDREKIRQGASSSTESVTWTLQEKYRFRPEHFKELSSYQAIALTTNGREAYLPTVVYLTRDFSDWNESWFDWAARDRAQSPVASIRGSR